MPTIKSLNDKIEAAQLELRQKENLLKMLIQKQKEQERKDRTKRLCKRMGLFESLLPETILLSEEQFKTFLDNTILTESAKNLLSELVANNTDIATSETAKSEVYDNAISTEKRTEIMRDISTRSAENDKIAKTEG